jgi:multiple sugar transport system substrate-binding protein
MGTTGHTTRTRRLIRSLAVLSVVTVTTTLAACGGGSSSAGSDKSSSGGSTKITVWHGYTDAEAKSIAKLGAQWNTEHPTQQVDIVFNGGNDTALQKTIAGFTAGNFPDVSYEYGSSLSPLSRQPKLVDLTDKVKDPALNWNDFFASERQAATVDGKVVGLPALVDNLALVYNKDLFKAAGVPEPTADWSWDDFRSAAAKLTDASKKQYGWAYVNDGTEDTVWRYLAMLWQAGGDLLTPDNTKPAFDSAAGLAALNQLKAMAVTDKSVYLDTGNQNYANLFNSGKVAMLWTGPWDLGTINPDVKYGVTLLPGYNGNHETISGPDLYVLFDHSDARADAGWAFTTWLTSAKVHLQFAIDTGDLPLRQSETELPDYQSKFLKKFPGDKVFVDNLNNVKHSRPNIPAYAEVSTAVGEMVQSVMLGKAEPQAALDAAKDQVTSALAGS